MRVVFLRNDIGIPSESFFAKMERILASLRVQSYNAKKWNPIFLQICDVLKCQNRLTSPVFTGKNLFFCIAKVYRFQSVTLGKSDTHRKFND